MVSYFPVGQPRLDLMGEAGLGENRCTQGLSWEACVISAAFQWPSERTKLKSDIATCMDKGEVGTDHCGCFCNQSTFVRRLSLQREQGGEKRSL